MATPTLLPVKKGDTKQQWMCDAVVPLESPLNVTLTCIVLSIVSITTVAEPVPDEPLGGTSSEPVRLATNVIESASATDADSIKKVAMAIAAIRSVRFIVYLPSKRLGNLPGSGLTVETSPHTFPNCSVVPEGTHAAVKAPSCIVVIPHLVF